MELYKSKVHPRINVDGKIKKIPLCDSVGMFTHQHPHSLDKLGIATQQYFKLLKSVVQIYLLLAFLSLPTYYIFGCGEMKISHPSFLSTYTIGNLGETQNQCIQNNMHQFNYTQVYCPMGTNITQLLKVGLSKNIENDNVCPNINFDTENGIKLDLDEECSWDFENRTRNDGDQNFDFNDIWEKGDAFYDHFHDECFPNSSAKIGFNTCKFTRMVNDWPSKCLKKIDTHDHSGLDVIIQKTKKKNQHGPPVDIWPLQVFIVVKCVGMDIDLSTSLFPNLGKFTRDDIGHIIVMVDLICLFVFWCYLQITSILLCNDSDRHRRQFLETKQFAVEIGNLPKLTKEYPLSLLRVELDHHIQSKIQTPDNESNQLVDIQFAMSNYKFLQIVKEIKQISEQIQEIDFKISKNDKNKKLVLKREEMYYEIFKLKSQYQKEVDSFEENNQVIAAFVTFRSMKGVEKYTDQSKLKWNQKGLLSMIGKKPEGCMMCNKILTMKPALDPELIHWHNFGISQKVKWRNFAIFLLLIALILLACFVTVLLFEKFIYDYEKRLPSYNCQSERFQQHNEDDALRDFYLDWFRRNGDWNCFCKSNENVVLHDGNPNKIEEASDYCEGNECSYCKYWSNVYLTTSLIGLIIPLVMGIGDVLIELFVQCAENFTKPINETTSLKHMIRGIAWIQFVNLGFVLIFVSIKRDFKDYGLGFINKVGIFDGQYNNFNSSWYIKFGATITQTLMIQVITPHIPALIDILFFKARRCYDRRCSYNKTKTRQIIQKEYEEVNTGYEFSLEARLAQMIASTLVTFMFSSGMPLLYIFMAVNFAVTFWIDKWLVLRFYRTPTNFTGESIRFSVDAMKLGIVFHFILGYKLISEHGILNSQEVTGDETHLHIEQYYLRIAFFAAIVNSLMWFFCQKKGFVCFKKLLGHEHKEEKGIVSEDFYNEINLKFLINEYQKSQANKTKYVQIMSKKQDGTTNFETNKEKYVNFIQKQEQKQQQLLAKFDEFCALISIDIDLPIEAKIIKLQQNEQKLNEKIEFRIKSLVQSYDIRDSEKYQGILQVENVVMDKQQIIIDKLSQEFRRIFLKRKSLNSISLRNSVINKNTLINEERAIYNLSSPSEQKEIRERQKENNLFQLSKELVFSSFEHDTWDNESANVEITQNPRYAQTMGVVIELQDSANIECNQRINKPDIAQKVRNTLSFIKQPVEEIPDSHRALNEENSYNYQETSSVHYDINEVPKFLNESFYEANDIFFTGKDTINNEGYNQFPGQ